LCDRTLSRTLTRTSPLSRYLFGPSGQTVAYVNRHNRPERQPSTAYAWRDNRGRYHVSFARYGAQLRRRRDGSHEQVRYLDQHSRDGPKINAASGFSDTATITNDNEVAIDVSANTENIVEAVLQNQNNTSRVVLADETNDPNLDEIDTYTLEANTVLYEFGNPT